MTVKEKVLQIVKNGGDMDADSIEKLIYVAYYMGRESATKQVSDAYKQLIAEQNQRAKACRYHKLAAQIIGPYNYVYSVDYAGDITATFGNDTTAL